MKKRFVIFLTIIALAITCVPMTGYASENQEISYDQVAGDSEKTTVEEVGVEGMFPIYGKDIVDGTYGITVESSSSMFKIEKAELTVKDGEMTVVMTMAAKGYLKVFMGTGAEAAASEVSEYIDFVEDEDGRHTYTVPVEALDMPVSCAAFSKDRKKWYDRSLVFEAESLPKEAVLVERPDYAALRQAAKEKRIAAMKAENEKGAEETAGSAEPVALEMEDGEYTVDIVLEGGTGRAAVSSPAVLLVRGGRAYARIEWSSSNYDYMKIGGQKYLPVNTEGNSVFEIPVTVMDAPMDVVADTTAMGNPHEIEYTLTFGSGSITTAAATDAEGVSEEGSVSSIVVFGGTVALAAIVVWMVRKKQKRS